MTSLPPIDSLLHANPDLKALRDPADHGTYVQDWRGLARGETPAVLLPASTDQVQAIVKWASQHQVALVPRGGGSGLVVGSIPTGQSQVVVSLERMNSVLDLDTASPSITVQAGCVLGQVKAQAKQAGLLFPPSFGSQDSCQIGGNLATNAGGKNALRYGSMRAQVQGIEAVLPDGSLYWDLDGLIKDNRGYDLKQLFVGSEGTLGIITVACLRLYPQPVDHATFYATTPSAQHAIQVLGALRAVVGDAVTSFELIGPTALGLVQEHSKLAKLPLAHDAANPYAIIGEVSLFAGAAAIAEHINAALVEQIEQGNLGDIVLASSSAQRDAMWLVREETVHCQKAAGASIKHDVSVPIAKLPQLLERGEAIMRDLVPGCRPCPFGHVGDGNLHFNCAPPPGMPNDAFLAFAKPMQAQIFDLVDQLGGSFSAEHGIGSLKIHDLETRLPPANYQLMRAIKQTLDPQNIMNPGKVFPD